MSFEFLTERLVKESGFMKTQKILPIVFSVDDNYVLPLSVAIKSLKEKCKKKCKIYVFFESLTEENKEKILAFSDEKTEIRLICLKEYIKNRSLYTKEHFTIAMYFRFFIPEILSEYEKVLYLDCDILVYKDFSALFDLDMQGKCIAGVHDEGVEEKSYINSGVLLFDVKKCKEFYFTEKCLKYVEEHAELDWPDQDTINAVCRENIYYLNFGCNFHVMQFYAGDSKLFAVNSLLSLCQYAKIKTKDVVFIHYIYHQKPWNSEMAHLISGDLFFIPLAKLWWKEASRLPNNYFKDEKQFKPKKCILKTRIKRVFLRLLGEKRYNKIKGFLKGNKK